MTPLPFYILLALAAGDLTSAELVRQAKHDVQAGVILRDRSLYVTINRLVKEKKISRRINSRGDIIYKLEPHGRRLLISEQARLRRAVMLLNRRLDDYR